MYELTLTQLILDSMLFAGHIILVDEFRVTIDTKPGVWIETLEHTRLEIKGMVRSVPQRYLNLIILCLLGVVIYCGVRSKILLWMEL